MEELMECLRDGVRPVCGYEAATWIYNLKYNMLKPSMTGMNCQSALGILLYYCIVRYSSRATLGK